jgi:hypothetical protein
LLHFLHFSSSFFYSPHPSPCLIFFLDFFSIFFSPCLLHFFSHQFSSSVFIFLQFGRPLFFVFLFPAHVFVFSRAAVQRRQETDAVAAWLLTAPVSFQRWGVTRRRGWRLVRTGSTGSVDWVLVDRAR